MGISSFLLNKYLWPLTVVLGCLVYEQYYAHKRTLRSLPIYSKHTL